MLCSIDGVNVDIYPIFAICLSEKLKNPTQNPVKFTCSDFLKEKGFLQKETELALLCMISRAVFPGSEHKTAQLLEQIWFFTI